MTKKREELLREISEENRKSTGEGMFLLQTAAQRIGMNMTDLQCVGILASTGAITAGRLAEITGLTTGAITGVINRLERAGYARREKDPADGRRVVIQPDIEKLESVGLGFVGEEDEMMVKLLSDYEDRDLNVILDFFRRSNAFTRREIEKSRAASDGGEFASSLGDLEGGRLVFAHGASRLTLRVGHGMEDLYQATFEGDAPKIKVEDGVVTVSRSRRYMVFEQRRHSEEFTLNASIPWEIEVRGGAAQVEGDLSGLKLSSLMIKSGISNLSLTLPEPSGLVPVRLSGGASKVSIRRPAGAEARLNVKGGAATLTFDEQSFDAVGGTVRLQSPGYDGASDRYDIELSGGASEISIR